MKPSSKAAAVPLPLAEALKRLETTGSYPIQFELEQRLSDIQLDAQDKKLWLKECELNAAYHNPRMAAEHERIWAELCIIRQARTAIEQKLYSSADEEFNL